MHIKSDSSCFSPPIHCRASTVRPLIAVLFVFFFLAAPVKAALMQVTTEILNEQRAKWALSGLTSYVYEGSALCFCPSDLTALHRVTVTNGVVTELLLADTLLPDTNPNHLQFYLPVEGLFDLLQDRIDKNWMTVDAMFDPTLGHPLDLFTDYAALVADDEYWFSIDSLMPVPVTTVPVPGTVPLVLLSLVGLIGSRLRRQVR